MPSSLNTVAFAVLAASCSNFQEQAPPPFRVAVSVEADKGVPLPGAVIQRNNEPIGRTEGTGKAILTFVGQDGDQLDVWVKCPDGFDSPQKPTTLMLRRLSGDKLAEYSVTCPPAERKVVVAIRADNGGNLPVKYLNKDIARTDPWGAATFMLSGKPGDKLDFVLDTSDKAYERLQPQSPTVSVVVDAKDSFYPLDQPFTLVKPKIVVAPMHRPQPIGPTPLRY